MKTSCLTIILLVLFYSSQAQFGPQQIITTGAGGTEGFILLILMEMVIWMCFLPQAIVLNGMKI